MSKIWNHMKMPVLIVFLDMQILYFRLMKFSKMLLFQEKTTKNFLSLPVNKKPYKKHIISEKNSWTLILNYTALMYHGFLYLFIRVYKQYFFFASTKKWTVLHGVK